MVQYIQAGGQTLLAYHPQGRAEQGQLQFLQTPNGQLVQAQQQLQLVQGPGGTQQLVMQQPQQVFSLCTLNPQIRWSTL